MLGNVKELMLDPLTLKANCQSHPYTALTARMSRRIAMLTAGTPLAGLTAFAAASVSKVTASAVQLVAGAAEPRTTAVAIGPDAPAGTHTAVTQLSGDGAAPYKNLKQLAFVRSVLPRNAEDALALRDAIDVLPGAGISNDAEIAHAKASMAHTAAVAVALAKQKGASKITILTKQATKYTHLNALWNDTIQAAAGAGVSVEVVGSATVANQLVMFPETLGVVVAADTPTAENVEGMLAGVLGGVERTYHLSDGSTAVGGNSVSSVGNAVAAALRAQGLTAEANKLTAALAKAPTDSQAVLNAL